jgi:hypothetical protein
LLWWWYLWILHSSWRGLCVDRYQRFDKRTASIFRLCPSFDWLQTWTSHLVQYKPIKCCILRRLARRLKQQVSPKRLYLSNWMHCVIFQKVAILRALFHSPILGMSFIHLLHAVCMS